MKTCFINGINLSYVERGQGTPLLLVHGFPFDHAMWDGQIEGLSAGHRVIAPDLRGFGQSGVSEGVVEMSQFADDLAALLDYLKIDKTILCGLSMGGYIAFEFWRKYAVRLQGLILSNTRAANDDAQTEANRRAVAEKVLYEGSQIMSDAMIPRIFARSTLQNRPCLVEKIKQVIARTDPRGIAAASLGMAGRADFTATLGNILCPTLVMAGSDDIIAPAAEMQALAKAIPGAEFKTIAEAGHMAPLEQPEAANAVIERFLGRIC